MSILMRDEIPAPSVLEAMSEDVLKHTANKWMEPYRILRSAYHDLLSSHNLLRKGKFPHSYQPQHWKLMGLLVKEDEWHLSVRDPLNQLAHMDKMSKLWFERWGAMETHVKEMQSALVRKEKEIKEESSEGNDAFLSDVAWGSGWKDGVRVGEDDEKELNEEEFLDKVDWIWEWKEGIEGPGMKVEMEKREIEMEETKKEQEAPASGALKPYLGPAAGDQMLL